MMIIRKVPQVVPDDTILDSSQAYQIERDDAYLVIGAELTNGGMHKRFIISDTARSVTREHTFIYVGNNFYPISIKPFYIYEPLQRQGVSLLCKEGIRRYHEFVYSNNPRVGFLTDEYLRIVGHALRHKDRYASEAFNQVLCTEPRLFKFTNHNNLTRVVRSDIDDFTDELLSIYYGSRISEEELFEDDFKNLSPGLLDSYVKLKQSPRAAIKRALRPFEPQINFDIRGDLFTRPSFVSGIISQSQINNMFRMGILEKETESHIDRYMEHIALSCDVYDCNDWCSSGSIVEFLQSCPYTDIWLTFINCDCYHGDKYSDSEGWVIEENSYVENRYLDVVYEGMNIHTAQDGHWCKILFQRINDLVDLFYTDRDTDETDDNDPVKIEFLYHNQVAMLICYTKTLVSAHCYDLILYNAISTSLIFGEEDEYVRP